MHEPLLLAALLKIASRIVFAEDPMEAVNRVEPLQRLQRSPRWVGLQDGFHYLPLRKARKAASTRLAPVMRALVTDPFYTADQNERRAVGLSHVTRWLRDPDT
ncbi:hypothetical protein [Streptomyces acidicola]|uniref:Uncharacterized protein n=1 Tax=Streptomyces acidicola TaxID=2596892 RepID=A0A5N8WP41_9ACTN|nr:hypothetical protein [Streptomyces acidicola]MPY48324.1 hypothetical protein [Streptomyces acidicola]